MDRRRFIPSAEGLEGRALLSSTSAELSILAEPQAMQVRSRRIDRLPQTLRAVQFGRFLPDDIVADIQADLDSIQGRLRPPSQAALGAFRGELRRRLSDASLGTDDVLALTHAFTRVLTSAGASAEAIESFRGDLMALASVDAAQVNPVALAANDYSVILQTALAVGRAVRTPGAPRLVGADDSRPRGDNSTTTTQPRLTGTYQPGATIEIVNSAGEVLGTGIVGTNRRYIVGFSRALTPGTYTVGVRGRFDDLPSPISRTITLTILPRTGSRTSSLVPNGPRPRGASD